MPAAPPMNALIVIGGAIYMHLQNIPNLQAAGILLAFLMEAGLFLATGSRAVRERLAALPPVQLAAGLTILTPFTWLLAGGGELWQVAGTTVIAAAFAFWYLRFPESDSPVLILYGVLALGKAAALLYLIPWEKAPTPIIGEFAWLRTLLFAVLLFRRPALTNYGFLPTKEEWKQGVKWLLLLLPAALAVGVPVGFFKIRALSADPSKIVLAIIGTFLGHFIFVALREEVLFRGMLLPKLKTAFGSTRGLLVSAVIFGAVHLLFGQFPNWRFALVGTVTGWFYGKSYEATGSIRSAMVTHALVNVLWRVFLST